MMKTKPLLGSGLCTLLLATSATGIAATPDSWDYMSLELIASGDLKEPGFPTEDIEGYRLDAAKEFANVLIVRALSNSYHISSDLDIGAGPMQNIDIDIGSQQLSVGAHYPVATGPVTLDMWGTANYERVTYAGWLGTGPGVDVGLRLHFTNSFEMSASGKVFGDIDFGAGVDADYTGYSITAAFRATPEIAFLGSYSNTELDFSIPGGGDYKSKQEDIFGLGVRFYY